MPILHPIYFELERCPYCNIYKPNLASKTIFESSDYKNEHSTVWGVYVCHRCGGAIMVAGPKLNEPITDQFPSGQKLSEEIPDRAREYLKQAVDSLQAPAGSVILSASSVDAMLKTKGYKNGSLNDRIKKASEDHLITQEMARWAHEVRLDANDQRHADENGPLPSIDDARKSIEFVMALGEFLFVLPSRVQRGLESVKKI